MGLEASFTAHADERVSERLHLTTDEIKAILDADPPRTVDFGPEQGTNRMHRLFFSKPDNDCFIAVQDVHTGEVVTIVPMDNRTQWRFVISLSAAEQAKKLALNGGEDALQERKRTTHHDTEATQSTQRNKIGKWGVVYLFMCPHTQRQISVRFGAFPIDMDGEGKTAGEIIKTSLLKNETFRQLVAIYVPAGAKGRTVQLLGKKGGIYLTIDSFPK